MAANPRAKFGGGSGENELDEDDFTEAQKQGAAAGGPLPSNYGLRNSPPTPKAR